MGRKLEAGTRERAEELRQAGLSRMEIARAVGVNRSTLHRWWGADPTRRPNLAALPGWRWCTHPRHAGPRWLRVTDFRPQAWYEDGTVKYVQSICTGCHNREQMARWRSQTPDERLKRQEYERRYRFMRRNGYDPDAEGVERVTIESFRPHWVRIRALARERWRVTRREGSWGKWDQGIDGIFDAESFRIYLGLSHVEYESLLRQMSPSSKAATIPLRLADRVLTAAGMEHEVVMLDVIEQRSSKAA